MVDSGRLNGLDGYQLVRVLWIHVRLLVALSSSVIIKLITYIIHTSWLNLFRDLALITVIGRLLNPVEDTVIKFGPFKSIRILFNTIASYFFGVLVDLPGVKGTVDKKVTDQLDKLEASIIQRGDEFPHNNTIPAEGFSPKDIQDIITQLNNLKQSSWENGRLSGAVYHGGAKLRELQTKVFGAYTFANQLHPDCFPAVRRMDAEVVSMVLDLYNGPKGSVGTTTSGGTESLLLACSAARELAKAKRGLTQFEIIAPITVHAGIDKAAHYFGMKLVHAPLNPKTMQVDLKAVKSLIGPNTVLSVGSAPNYPHGIIDDIEGLGKIALKQDLPLHVDACLGSFIVPFSKDVGGQTLNAKEIPKFDFRVPGVTSISCDTHKYGFAPKGSSVIMYRSAELRKMQYFVSTDWSGGLYASPTLAGSRPGALVAGCWATLMYMGKDGYRRSAESIIGTSRRLRKGLEQRPDLFYILGNPQGSVVSFASHKVNIYDLSDALSKKGWHLAALQNPPALHMAATELTGKVVDELVKDLIETAEDLVAKGSDASASEGTKALYGVAGSVSTAGIAERLAEGFVDFLYKT